MPSVNELLRDILEASGGGSEVTNPGFEFLHAWESDIQQDAGEDVKTVIECELGGTSDPDGILSYSAGVWTVTKGGPLWIKNRFRVSRTGQAGVSEVFFMAEVSVDGGLTWQKLPQAEVVDVKLENSNALNIFFDLSPISAAPGLKFRQVMSRSSEGTNDGSIIPGTPSAAQQAIGFEIAPSAFVAIYKAIDFNYV